MAETTKRRDRRVIQIRDGDKCRYVRYMHNDSNKIHEYSTTIDLQSAFIFTDDLELSDITDILRNMIPFAEVTEEEVDIQIAIRKKDD